MPLKRGLPSSLLARGSYPPGTPCAFSGSLFQRAEQAIELPDHDGVTLAQLIEQAVKLAPDRAAHATGQGMASGGTARGASARPEAEARAAAFLEADGDQRAGRGLNPVTACGHAPSAPCFPQSGAQPRQ